MSQGFTKGVPIDTDVTLSTNSNLLVPSQYAIKTYVDTADATLQTNINAKQNQITATTSADYYRGDKTFQTLNKTAVGLGNVDNTSDANKPVSTAQQTAINNVRDISYYRRKGGIWHSAALVGNLANPVSAVANTIYLMAFTVSETITITDIGYNVTATGTTTLARCGIYSSNANGEPNIALADSGNLGVSLGPKSITLATPLVLNAGLYWTAYIQNGTGSINGCPASATLNFIGSSTGISTSAVNGFNKVISYGALPTLIGLTQNLAFLPIVWFRIS